MNSTDFDFDLFFSLGNDLCYPFHQYNNLSSRLHLPFLSPFIHIATAGGLVDEHIYERKIHFQIRKKIKLLHDDMKMGYELNPKLDKILEQKKTIK
ncbi:TPA: hypothetical protein RUX41_001229 [Aeromonas dhakensis]|nr:hypothetical protein [Aeromonas dhakensis]